MKNIIMIFFEIDEKLFNTFKYKTILDMNKIIENILETKQDLIKFFVIDGVEYGLNPDFNDQLFGEMTDCDTDDVVTQMAILYRPIVSKKNNKYTIAPYEANIDIYEKIKNQLTADYYIGFVSFFLRIHESFVNYTQKFLTVQASHQKKKPNSPKNGAGILGSMNLLEVI